MKFKGNFVLMFAVQLLSGIWTYYACSKFGLAGVGYGFIPFLLILILVQTRHTPDERELALLHKTESIQGMVISAEMAVVYMFFPELNWFYVFVSSISVIRGATGMVLFLTR